MLEIPEPQRAELMVFIDGDKQEVPAAGPLQYQLAAGDHRVKMIGRGRRAACSVSLKAGEKHSQTPAWSEDDALAAAVHGNVAEPKAPDQIPGADAAKKAEKTDLGTGQPDHFPAAKQFAEQERQTRPAEPPGGHAAPAQPPDVTRSAAPARPSFGAPRKRVATRPLPSLDGVVWADQPVTLRDLRGKTVIMLIYDYEEGYYRDWSDGLLDQLKAAIRDKPVVVLAIDITQKPEAGPAYLRERKFTAPNIIAGRDPLMPSRLLIKDAYFHYAWIDPEGRLKETGNALTCTLEGRVKEFDLPQMVTQLRNLGKFEVLEANMPAKVKQLVWPFEFGRISDAAALKKAARELTAEDAQTFEAAVTRFLDGQLKRLHELARGSGSDRLFAYDQATRLAAAYKTRGQGKEAKESVGRPGARPGLQPGVGRPPRLREGVAGGRQESGGPRAPHACRGDEIQGRLVRRAPAQGGNEDAVHNLNAWPKLTDAEQEAEVKKQRAFYEEVRQKLSDPGLQFYETKRFLFFSDIPAHFITSWYLPNMDQMYVKVSGAYGLDPAANIWKGKATIIAFAKEETFQQFEVVFHHARVTGAQGLAHLEEDGTVVITCFAGDDPKYLATTMVHETTHGFNWRYKAAERLPSWMDEGAAEWVASHVVTCDHAIPEKMESGLRHMRSTRSLGNIYTLDYLASWQYGAATMMTDFLMHYEPPARNGGPAKKAHGKSANRYRQLIEGIKLGLPWEDSLKQAYGLTPAELAQVFGASIGVPDLKP